MENQQQYRYKFSVVIPIYNVEEYLRETIDSVVNQTIGFKENVQIILVNDGSPDNSEAICLEYREKYPDNVIYVKQDNAGKSAARNAGIQYIEGKYVNFLDSDDKWETDVFEKVYAFFEEHYDEIDVVACRLRYFEARTGYNHPLNVKFTENRIIDISEEYGSSQLQTASTFIKRDTCIQFNFCEDLKYGEDARFINEVILNKQKFGVMRDAIYLYRKRNSRTSSMDTAKSDISFYGNTLKNFHKCLLAYSRQKFGTVIPYIQYVVMYEIQWRIKAKLPKELADIKDDYYKEIRELLEDVENYIIMEQRNLPIGFKVAALSLKHGRDIRNEFSYDNDGNIHFDNVLICNPTEEGLQVDTLEIKEDSICISGNFSAFSEPKDYGIYAISNNQKEYKPELAEIEKGRKKDVFGNVVQRQYEYRFTFPFKQSTKFSACFRFKNYPAKRMTLHFNASSGNEHIIYCKDKVLHIEKNTRLNRLKHRIKSSSLK